LKRIAKRALFILLFGLGGILFLLLAVVLLFQLPDVQQFAADKTTSWLSNKTKSAIRIQRLYIRFPESIVLEGLFAEDLSKDTLIYVRKLETDLAMMDLLDGKVTVGNLDLEGVRAKIVRTLPDSAYNFGFILQAFAGKEPTVKSETDTSSTPLKISLKSILLQDIRLVYDDAVTGMYSKAHLGKLSLNLEETDLENMRFKGGELLLSNSSGIFEIRKPQPPSPKPQTKSLLPELALRTLTLRSVDFGFHNLPDSSFFDFLMGNVSIEPKKIDLNGENIELQTVRIQQSDIRISMQKKPEKSASEKTDLSSQSQWKASLTKLELEGNRFRYEISNLPVQKSGMDYNHLDAKNIQLIAKDLSYSPSLIKGEIENLAIQERCGLEVKQLRTRFEYDSVHANLDQLFVKTNSSYISSHLSASYPSLSSLAAQPGNLKVNAVLEDTRISMADVLQFAPDLIRQPIILKNKTEIFSLDGNIKGLLKDLLIQNMDVRMASDTRILLNGRLKGLPDPEQLAFNLQLKNLHSSRTDLHQLLPREMIPASIRIPDRFSVSGIANGKLKNWNTNLHLNGSDGKADVKAGLAYKSSKPVYSGRVLLWDFHAGRILKQNPTLGRISASLNFKGESFDPEKITAEVNGEIKSLETKDYTYQHSNLSVLATKGIYQADVAIRDPNLDLDLIGTASMKKDSTFARLNLNLNTANLQSLRIYQEDLKLSARFKVDVKNFDPEKMTGKASIKNLLVLKDGQKIEMDSLVAVLKNVGDDHTVTIKGDVLDLDYKGNHSPILAAKAVQEYLSNQLGNPLPEPVSENQEFVCSIELKPHRILKEAFLPELKQFTGISFDSKFGSRAQTLNITASSTLIEYADNTIRDLLLNIDGDANKIDYEVSVLNLQNGNILIPKSRISGQLEDKILAFGLLVSHPDSGDRLKVEGTVNQQTANETILKLTGNSITFNNEKWKIPVENEVRILPEGIVIQAIGLEKDGQSLTAQSSQNKPNSPIDIRFNQFEIGTLSQIIEKDTALFRGSINGDVHIKKLAPFGFTSDLSISNIAFREIPVGNLSVKADNLIANRYSAVVNLSGDSNDVKMMGYYESEIVDFDVQIRQLQMKSLEAFASSLIRKSSGYISGKMKITGKATEPKINGDITFHEAGFNLIAINNQVLLKDETIKINNDGIHFKDFTLLDSEKQPMIVNGSILSSNLKDMNFKLDITTRNFTVLNTTAKDNPEYYGTLILNSLVKIRGNQNLPVLSANAELLDGSTFTFVVLEGDLNISKGEGVVVFEDSIRISNKTSKDTVRMKTGYKGLDLNANIEVNKNSIFRIIVDPESGDNLEVSGDANLAFGIDPGGKVSLSGVYILNDGHYQASFQKVLKREFKIKSGSRITWSGDPMDGQIDLIAIYKTQAAATDLMSTELAGVSENERAAYRKLLNYNVNLIINGPLLKPQLQFNLGMPPADQLAFGGLVYSKVNQLNTDPNELNKQVFSLLVLNKFIPTGSSGVSTGSAVSTLARNSVNQMLTDQLNILSGKYVKGAELNFNLQTTEDFQGGETQQNTALQVGVKKELFNSRLSLQVGSSIDLSGSKQNTSSSNGQSLTGDVLVEYKLTPDGRLRLKAFRENQYEGVIDGILYKTGLGISYTRDYNEFRDLWKSPKKEIKD